MKFTIPSNSAGPLYAFPSSESDFDDWATLRVQATGSAGNWSIDLPLTGADSYHVFEGSTAPTSWDEWVVFIDLVDAKKLNTINALVVGGRVYSASPVTGNATLPFLVIGDDYYGDRALVFYIDPPTGVDIGDASAFFGVEGSNVEGALAEVTVDDEPKWSLTFELSRDFTGAVEEGQRNYSFEVRKPNGEASQHVTKQRGVVKFLIKSVSNS